MTEITETQYAWLAGMIDADGCFTFHKNTPCIEVSLTHRETIEYLQATWGGGVYTPTVPRPNAKQYWKWSVSIGWMKTHLHLFVPYMVTKQARAALIQEYVTLSPGRGSAPRPPRLDEIKAELKVLNKRGVA